MQYYQVPAELIEDTEALRPWVAAAIEAARRKPARLRKRSVHHATPS